MKHRLERTGPRLSLQWRGRDVMLGYLHNPNSKKRPWTIWAVKEEVMGNMIASLIDAHRTSASSPHSNGGAGEPAGEHVPRVWALGGDFNIGHANLELLAKTCYIFPTFSRHLRASDKIQNVGCGPIHRGKHNGCALAQG